MQTTVEKIIAALDKKAYGQYDVYVRKQLLDFIDEIKEIEADADFSDSHPDRLPSVGEFIKKLHKVDESCGQETDIISFGMYLTGHDRGTIEQMYRDWQ